MTSLPVSGGETQGVGELGDAGGGFVPPVYPFDKLTVFAELREDFATDGRLVDRGRSRSDVRQLDEKLFFEVFAVPQPPQKRAAGTRR